MSIPDSGLSPDMTPDASVNVRKVFGIDNDLSVPAFSERSEYVPVIDEDYVFDPDTTLAILAGFNHNRRTMIQGYHGTGKSTHIEQVAARLNWPCIRVNLDSHISRIDLIGKSKTANKSLLFARVFCRGHCSTRQRWFLMSTMRDAPTLCL